MTDTDMVRIPAGTFQMGSANTDAPHEEQPIHTVHLDAFNIDIYPVTNAQFKTFVDANPHWQKDNIEDRYHDGNYLKHWNSNTYPNGKANHPVVFISWYSATAYAQWNDKRLPTEAEWEYAARGGLTSNPKYPWGNNEPPIHRSNWHAACLTTHFARERQQKGSTYQETAKGFAPKHPPAWIEAAIKGPGENIPAVANFGSYFGGTTPVGCFPANGYDLYDMAGNVWEWCIDPAIENFYKDTENHRNPIARGWDVNTFPANEMRILRGGSCNSSAHYLRVACRGSKTPETTNAVCGCRCVQDIR